MRRKVESISDIAARQLPSTVGSRAFVEIAQAWPLAVGGYLSSQSRPAGFAKGELIIEAADEVVANELRFSEDEIRGRLSKWLRPTTRLRIRVSRNS